MGHPGVREGIKRERSWGGMGRLSVGLLCPGRKGFGGKGAGWEVNTAWEVLLMMEVAGDGVGVTTSFSRAETCIDQSK